jgi:glyoxylase-like metal-dependent hydrolase (beta-lactamase superfamily II)
MVPKNVELCAPGVYRLRTLMVNAFFVASEGHWVLVDTGMRGYADVIARAARQRFTAERPSAIVLTHGHFDHIGGLPALAERWGAPVYAHPLEMPYLTGRSAYQPPDPTVGGGVWSLLSPVFPRRPINLGPRATMLPADGSIPGLPGWRWIATPGHTPGHISLFRESDRTLIAGDAVVTTRQESLSHVLTQRPIVWRPPAYFTGDWDAAERSVRALAELEPQVLATGHGPAMSGASMRTQLHHLADRFADFRPTRGRYVADPVTADHLGIVHVPRRRGPNPAVMLGVAGLAAGVAYWAVANRSKVDR